MILNALYNLIIAPIEMIFEVIFCILQDYPALAIYRTLNQVFSVAKNIVMKIIAKYRKPHTSKEVEPMKASTFILGAVFLTVFIGAVIPITLIGASPADFTTEFSDILGWIFHTLCLSAGYFIVWLGIYYFLSRTKVRNIFIYVVWVFSGVFILDHMIFNESYGTISAMLTFDTLPTSETGTKLLNLLAVAAVIAAFIVIMHFFKKFINYVYIVLLTGSLGLIVINGVTCINTISEIETGHNNGEEKVIKLSKTGRNVIVFMLDRAAGGISIIMAST